MRVTNAMMTNRLMTNINKNLTSLNKYNIQMSSGKKIQYASENPLIASRALRYRTAVSDAEQYSENVTQARSWSEVTESAVKNVTGIVTSMSELMVKAGSDSNTSQDKLKIIKEYGSLLTQLENELNATHMGRYVFSGYKTDTAPVIKDADGNNILNELVYGTENPTGPPFQQTGADLPIDGQYIEITVGVNTNIQVNSLATSIYDRDDYNNLHVFDKVEVKIDGVDYKSIEDFLTNTYPNLTDEQKESADKQLNLNEKIGNTISNLETFLSKVSNEHTSIGVKENRLELVESRLGDEKTSYKTLMSDNEDINLAEAAMDFNVANTAYNAALNVGMKINQMSLVDYL